MEVNRIIQSDSVQVSNTINHKWLSDSAVKYRFPNLIKLSLNLTECPKLSVNATNQESSQKNQQTHWKARWNEQ